MYRDELEAMQARLRTLEAQLVAEQKQRVAAEAETRVAEARLAEAKLATEQTAEKRVRLSSPTTIWILAIVLALMVALGVGLLLRVQQYQQRSAQQLQEAHQALTWAQRQLAEAERKPPEPPKPPAPVKQDIVESIISGTGGSGHTLTREQIMAGMKSAAVQARVRGCFEKFRVPGVAVVVVTVAPSGEVSSAGVKGQFAGTETGACLPSAALSARFPPFRGKPLTFDYPFILR
jgi:hypothetical protein